jgi:hypothetical protein
VGCVDDPDEDGACGCAHGYARRRARTAARST